MIRAGHPPPLTACVLAIVACMALAVPSMAAPWKRVDSNNFVVVGDVGERELRDVAKQFEVFRGTIERLLGPRFTGNAAPTVVVVFASDREFTPYKLRFNGKPVAMSGLFMGSEDLGQIAIVAGFDQNTRHVIFHEYTHQIVANALRNPPLWFNEGFAEYYSTFDVSDEGRTAEVGRAVMPHVARLRETSPMPIETLVTLKEDSPLYNEGDRRSIFYAESWALTHYLLTDPARLTLLASYLGRVSAGASPLDTWRAVFGSQVDAELRRYVERPEFQYTRIGFHEGLAKLTMDSVPITEADAQVFLASLLVNQGRLDEAAERLAAVSKLDPTHVYAKVMLGQLELMRNRPDDAEARLAGAGDPGDWFVAYQLGVALSRVLDAKPRLLQPDDIAPVRRLFDQVKRQRTMFANATALLVALEARTIDVPSAASLDAIRQARRAVPGRDRYGFIEARVLAVQGDFQAARDVVGPFMAPWNAPGTREAARSMMENILQLENRKRVRTESLAARAADAAATPPSSPSIIPIFRPLGAGEERIEGALERIDCQPGGTVSFILRTPAGAVTLRAARMSGVEFISHRDDVAGSVSCGRLKEPWEVYVTVRKGIPPAAKQVVAVEIRPKPIR